jgi:hypothetical protein
MAKKDDVALEDKTFKATENHTAETVRTQALGLENEKRAKAELKKTVASIGGDVTIVEIDNSKNKLPSEAEQRYNDGVESAKKQRAEAAKKAKKEAENA